MATTEQSMKVEPSIEAVDLDTIPEIQREGKSSRIVESFLQSGNQAVEVKDGTKGFSASLKRYVKANDLGDRVEVLTRGGRTFLRYKNDDEAEANTEA